MKKALLATLLLPAALVASPPPHIVSPTMWSEAWVKDAVTMAKAKGIGALVAEVQNPAGKFRTGKPETDPELTIYSDKFVILAVNRMSRHVGMDHTKMPDALGAPVLKKMRAFALESGPGWLDYLGTDASGHYKPFKAYVALEGSNLIAAVIPK